MNQHFLNQMISVLKKGFSRVITDRENNIVVNSNKLPISGISARCGDFEIKDAYQDDSFEKPHPVAFREEFRVMRGKAKGPYQLELIPINDVFSCKLVYHPSKNIEEEKLLNFPLDFGVNDQNEVIFQESIAKATLFYLDYEVAGISTTSSFQQEIFLDIYDDQQITAEKYASLASSILLTNTSQIIEKFNTLKTAEYGGKRYQSHHRMNTLRWVSTSPQSGGQNLKLTMKFMTEGLIHHVKVMDESIEVIRKVPLVIEEPR